MVESLEKFVELHRHRWCLTKSALGSVYRSAGDNASDLAYDL
jgi:hypothetical protein